MIGETIRTEFEALKNDFETIRQQIEDDVVRTELYKGEFYELTPYSYQGPWFKSKRKSKVENLSCKHSSLAQSVRASDC